MNKVTFPPPIAGYSDWFEVIKTYAACERVLAKRCQEVGLTLAQHDILAALLADGPLRQKDLAARLFVAKSNVAAVLSRMERDGLVERIVDPSDGRAKLVSTTAEGQRRAELTLAAQQDVAQGMIAQLSPEECAVLGDMMRRVRAYLNTQ